MEYETPPLTQRLSIRPLIRSVNSYLINPLLQSKHFAGTPAVHLHNKAPIPDSLVAISGHPIAPVLSDEDDYCWVFHPSYGFYFMEGISNNHYRFFKGEGKGSTYTEIIPNKLYDDCNRGYAFVDRKKKTVQIQTASRVKDWLDFVPKQVLNGFKKAFPGYDVYLKGCHLASLKNKVALDALLEMYTDEDYATHQHHSDPGFTTQNGKDYAGSWSTEIEEGSLNDSIPGNFLIASEQENIIQSDQKMASKTKKIATNYPNGYRIDKNNPEKGFKWIWSKPTGSVLFNFYSSDHVGVCDHADMCAVNYLDYDETEKGFIILDNDVLHVRCIGSASELRDEAVDDVIDDFLYQFPSVKNRIKRIDIEARSYNGIYKDREDTSLNPLVASKKCASCECGDCLTHSSESINDLTNSVVTPPTPVEEEINDATFFKESEDEDEFEVSRTASGKLIITTPLKTANDSPQGDIGQQEAEEEEQEQLTQEEIARFKQADTKSYGVGTPNGVTPSAPNKSNKPNPPDPEPNPVPPVYSQNKTPEQLSQEAQNSSNSSNSTNDGGKFTPQQVQQVLQALKTSGELEEFPVEKFAEQIRLAAIPIKETPSSLPPRDDIRRHIDETAQDEVMDGVENTPDTSSTMKPQPQPQPALPQEPVNQTAQQELLKQTLSSDQTKSKKRFRTTDSDKWFVRTLKTKNRKLAVQTEEGVNLVCPACHSTESRKLETNAEDGSLVECLACGCFFAV